MGSGFGWGRSAFYAFPTLFDMALRVQYYYRVPITKSDTIIRNFFLGFIRLHILHHASIEPIFGLDMIRELGTHGYSLSPGTLYPILHGLERDGFLQSQKQVVGGKVRRCYLVTESGRSVLAEAMKHVGELMEEVDANS